MPTTAESLQRFVDYCQRYITGDEQGQAQIFLDRFCQAFGYEGALQTGATFTPRIDQGSESANPRFSNLFWKNRVLIQMKKRGSDLRDRNYRTQAESYYISMKKSDRPPYVILCNFDEFHIYDFDNQPDDPVDIIALQELPRRLPAFSFMEEKNLRPQFKNNQVEITEKVAIQLGDVLQLLLERGKINSFKKYTFIQAKRFILQCVLGMYGEDIGLLPPAMFTGCLQDCMENPGYASDILGGLFQAMNQPGVVRDGRYLGVEYLNSRLLDEIHSIQLEYGELNLLLACAGQDWSKVRPSIFGNLFEGALNYTDKTKDKSKQQRHVHGIHFTSEVDIRSIVLPTIREYWQDRINRANSLKGLRILYHKLINYKVLDPACGSGNFLYVAYQELKYIEKILLEKIANFEDISVDTQKVSPQQFYGMDINAFAVELAKVTLMIGRKITIDQLGLNESSLPLDTLDKNIICADALFTNWVQADVIIGNPPFLGSKHIRLTLGDEYVNQLFKRFPGIRDVDFCAYWFRLTHDQLGDKGRSGLVATNSISQGKSRAVSLDYITENGGYIYQAISSQPWSGDAKVHVSIVNWSKTKPNHYILDGEEVTLINSSLQSTVKVSQAVRLKANLNRCFQGVIPLGMGFIITEKIAQEWINRDQNNQAILKLFSMGANLAKKPLGKPERWIIDFNEMTLEECHHYPLPFEQIKNNVRPERLGNRAKKAREYWWQFFAPRPGMRAAIANLSYYFTVPRLSKWAIFLPASIEWLAGDQSVVVATEDYYILGILLSDIHRIWVKAQSSTLKGDTRYTHTTCFETFPFPQSPAKKTIENIRKITIELHEYRSQEMIKKGWGITQLYNKYYHEPASNLYRFHRKLDQLVREAYHFKSEDNILEKLLELNQECATKESRGELVIGAVARCFLKQPQRH